MSKVKQIAANWQKDMRQNKEHVYGTKWGGEELFEHLDFCLAHGEISGHVYEIGCGGGRLTKKLFEWGAERVTATDVHSDAINKTKAHEPRARVMKTDGESIPGGPYDIVFSWGVLLHLPQYLVQHYFDCARLASSRLIFALPTFELPKGLESYSRFVKNKTWRNPYFTGYFNHYTEKQVLSMLGFSGWRATQIYTIMERELLYICEAK